MLLLETRTVGVPAKLHVDADLAQRGYLSTQVMAGYGAAAIAAGAPDAEHNELGENAVDAIANVLHHVAAETGDPLATLDKAWRHWLIEKERT